MQHTDSLFLALTKRETFGGGLLPYDMSIYVTMAAMIALIAFEQWVITGVMYAGLMTLMAVLQARDEDIFSILALQAKLWSRSWSRNCFYWRARSYKP